MAFHKDKQRRASESHLKNLFPNLVYIVEEHESICLERYLDEYAKFVWISRNNVARVYSE